MCVGRTPDGYISENTTQTPHILIFQIATCSKAVNLNGQYILAWFNVFGYIKFSNIPAIHAVAYFFAINPQEKTCIHAIEAQKQTATVPVLWNFKLPAITSNGITFCVS